MGANQEIIAELRRVLNERDDAREQLDLTKRELGRWVDRETKAARERDEARAEVERLREMAHDFEAMREDRNSAYRRGAEAMREACLGVVERFMDFGSPHPGMIAHKISALPIPEEP